jgi:hypothetical protein
MGCDFEIISVGGHRADSRFAVAGNDVQIAGGCNRLNGIKLHRDIAGKVGFKHQFLAVGLADRSG